MSTISRRTLNVTDVEETGKVAWVVDPDGGDGGTTVPAGVVLRQFQPGAELTASVTDPDACRQWRCSQAQMMLLSRGSGTGQGRRYLARLKPATLLRRRRRWQRHSCDGDLLGRQRPRGECELHIGDFGAGVPPVKRCSRVRFGNCYQEDCGEQHGQHRRADRGHGRRWRHADLRYRRLGADGASFRIDPATGQLMVGPNLMIDFEGMRLMLATATRLGSLPTTLPALPPTLWPR